MTDRELKLYAVSGLLVIINAEQDKLKKSKDNESRKIIQDRIDKLIYDYEELLRELKNNEYWWTPKADR